MPMETVNAEVRAFAERTGRSEAEIVREALHLAALRARRRSRPLMLRRFDSGDPATAERRL